MWEKLKETILNLFTERVEIEEDPVDRDSKNSLQIERKSADSIQRKEQSFGDGEPRTIPKVRMMYQYPEERSFRFPVHVDQNIEREKRARQFRDRYQGNRPNSKSNIHQEKMGYQKKDRLEPLFRDWERKKETIEEQRPKKPFVPTEVPSPIYGYQQREKKKDIDAFTEELKRPAYLRRKAQKIASAHELGPDDPSSSNKGLEIDTVQTEVNEKEDHQIKETVKGQLDQEALPIEKEADRLKTNEEKNERHDAIQALYKNMTQFAKMEKAKESVPYNVIMTGKDYGVVPIETKQDEVNIKTQGEAKQVPKESHEQLITPTSPKDVDVPLHLLDDMESDSATDDTWIEEQKHLLEETFKHFNVKAEVVHATKGPSVTRFEVQPELGVKVSRIRNLSDDLKLNMSAKDIRIEAPIPGKNAVGIEIPNKQSRIVKLEEILTSDSFQKSASPLTIGLGLNIEGEPVVTNIGAMPHGLIAGATGSGKSVCINTILVSLLYKASHEEVKFLLIDPKMVELAPYNGIPHLVSPVITDIKAATAALKWAVAEMENRYEQFVTHGVRDIERFNAKMAQQQETERMPYLVIVIDELADLMMMAPQDVEDSICRIAQKARACGIHLIIATQRPSVDVITGLIKANVPTRIAFSVSQQVDSRTILDVGGAERLLGKGDMLFIENGAGQIERIQGAFVSDEEIERVTAYARSISEPNYLFEQEQLLEQAHEEEEKDELFFEVINYIIEANQVSTSSLQRQFRIGYNRAARLMDTLESMGIVNQQNGSKPRDVLLTRTQIEEML